VEARIRLAVKVESEVRVMDMDVLRGEAVLASATPIRFGRKCVPARS
jgi:hypothetical protein